MKALSYVLIFRGFFSGLNLKAVNQDCFLNHAKHSDLLLQILPSLRPLLKRFTASHSDVAYVTTNTKITVAKGGRKVGWVELRRLM